MPNSAKVGKRDPRIDPRMRDELKRSWLCRKVIAISPDGRIRFYQRQGAQWLNGTFTVTQEEWQQWAKDAEVIHAADDSAIAALVDECESEGRS